MLLTIVYVLLLALVYVFVFTLYKRNKKLRHDNLSLKGKIAELEEARLKLEDTYKGKLVISNLLTTELVKKEIGANIHDFLGSMLWAVKVQLGVVAKVGQPNEAGQKSIAKANEIMEDALDNTKSVIQGLVPKTLMIKGLSEAIHEHCQRISTDQMIFEFSEIGEAQIAQPQHGRTVILFRVVQEILNNCLKYSEATRIIVHASWGPYLLISIVNNGKAFQIDESLGSKTNSIGVFSILERIKALGGTLTSEAGPPNTLIIEVPTYEKRKSIHN